MEGRERERERVSAAETGPFGDALDLAESV